MSSKTLNHVVEQLEPWLIGLLLLHFFGFNFIPTIGKVLNVGSYGIISLWVIWRWKRIAYVATKDLLLLLLVGMVMVSVYWSAAPDVTSTESKTVLRMTLFGAYLASRYTIKEQIHLLANVLGVGVVLSFVLPQGRPFKNLFAALMTLTALVFVFTAINTKRRRWLSWSLLALAVILLVSSKGKTAYAVFVISLCLGPLYTLVKQQYKLRVFLFCVALLLGGSGIILALSNLEFIVVDTLGKDLTFSGRTDIWVLILDKIMQRPLLGYGMFGFWPSAEANYVLYHSWANVSVEEGVRFNAHNGYLDLILSLGFLGFSLYLLIIIISFMKMLNLFFLTQKREFLFLLQFMVSMFLLNYSDSLNSVTGNTFWVLYVSFNLSTAVQQDRLKKQRYLSTALSRGS